MVAWWGLIALVWCGVLFVVRFVASVIVVVAMVCAACVACVALVAMLVGYWG